ncbi:MAG: hypothetical protein WC476_12970 [Phycisphaerae bacterium]|jgi:hypothetical protein
MTLYLISQLDEENGRPWYTPGTWYGAVVAAESVEEAKAIHPSGWQNYKYELNWPYFRPERIQVRRLGRAAPGVKKGVIIGRMD